MAAQVGDYVSTKDAFSRGCIEGNSTILGENPDDAALLLAKFGSGPLITWAGKNIKNHTARKWWYGTTGLLVGGVVLHNYNITCR